MVKTKETNYRYIMWVLGFTCIDISNMSGIPLNNVKFQIRSGEKVPPLLKQCFRQWAELINSVAEFFGGDRTKTKLWFSLRNPCLGDISPREIILIGRYEKLLRFVINALSENS